MRIAQAAPRRGFERTLAILSAFAVFMSLMVMFAPAALAHHPLISAGQTCVDGKVAITYESISWKTDGGSGSGHSNIRIEVLVNGAGSWAEVGSGSYTAGNNYRFSGTFDAGSYLADNIQVRARAVGAWDNGQGGGETSITTSFMVDQVCSEDVSVTANPQVCAVNQQGVPQGAVSFNVDPASGATIQVYTNSNFSGPLGGPLGDDEVLNLAPGTYYWQATAAPGFDLDGTDSGQFTIAPCSASTVVVSGVCAIDTNGAPVGSVQVTIDPNSGATVVVSGPGGPYNFSGNGGSIELAPGSYTWQATAAPGFSLGSPSAGQFTIAPCSASTVVVSGVCAVNANDAPVGSVQVTIDPNSGATVVVSGPGGPYNFSGNGGSIELAPGSYSWQATAGPGFALGGPTSGTFDIDPCEGWVSVTSDVCESGNGALGEVEVDIDPDYSAVVTVYSDAGMTNAVETFDDDGGTADLAPGTYYWAAVASGGFALSGDTSGSFTIDPCVGSVAIDSDVCVIGADNTPIGSVQVVIDPDSGATVVVSGPGGPYNFTGSGGSQGLAPGSYTWEATPGSGFTLSGDTSGGFTIDPCDVSVVVVNGQCEIVDGPSGTVTVSIDANSGANVSVFDDELNVTAAFTGTGGSSALPPGDYTWEATPGAGFDFPSGQATSGSFTVDPCDGSVIVSHGNCIEGAATAFGSVTVVIDPASGAVVSILNGGGLEVASFDGTGGSRALTVGVYTWNAEASAGFGLVGDTEGQFRVVGCADEVLGEEIVDDEVDDLVVLPFTGVNTETLFGASIVLLGSGLLMIRSTRRREEAVDS